MNRVSTVILLLQLALTVTLMALVAIELGGSSGVPDASSYLGAAAGLAITVAVLAAVRLLISSNSQHLDSRP